ncbi:hypothetical protein [Sphingobacterium bovistauri]|uniref:Outer membrane protein beta-barrel domain-containing protein n=1 Tax=Sphingobacterium bovistauri TaxID=2781959 RepID=A0ABS7Z4F5_9SPHI|nr:hypothetical protein [Sphingobacterium bovistauri]MCA5003760.1 hypothetical protein [Sphingobacterium bovistauri]
MRILTIFILILLVNNSVNAQYCPPLVGKVGEIKRFHITGGYGVTSTYGDISENEEYGSAGTILVDYQFTKGVLIGLESQFGTLISGSSQNANVMQSHNNYFAGGFRLSFFPFSFFSNKKVLTNYSSVILESLYLGVGSLYIINSYDYVYRDYNQPKTFGTIAGYNDIGEPIFRDRTRSLILPSMNVGCLIPLKSNMSQSGSLLSLVLNAQSNFSQDDELDGYTPYGSDGSLVEGKNDVYNFYSLGLRYSF